jgi:hypothetical protein
MSRAAGSDLGDSTEPGGVVSARFCLLTTRVDRAEPAAYTGAAEGGRVAQRQSI